MRNNPYEGRNPVILIVKPGDGEAMFSINGAKERQLQDCWTKNTDSIKKKEEENASRSRPSLYIPESRLLFMADLKPSSIGIIWAPRSINLGVVTRVPLIPTLARSAYDHQGEVAENEIEERLHLRNVISLSFGPRIMSEHTQNYLRITSRIYWYQPEERVSSSLFRSDGTSHCPAVIAGSNLSLSPNNSWLTPKMGSMLDTLRARGYDMTENPDEEWSLQNIISDQCQAWGDLGIIMNCCSEMNNYCCSAWSHLGTSHRCGT
ncbi:NADP-dependent isocitrate dehydrogenase [Sesbania bispinosa]|nr:NADP-dependent isocitrate dehydrogenase [Sesbania bispinosa]